MTNTTLFETWYDEVWNKANENFIKEMLHPDAIIHGLLTEPGKTGTEAFLPFYKNFREQFPYVSTILNPILSCNGFEAAECIVTVTAANGKVAILQGISIAKFIDGKLVEGWNAFDFVAMQKQLELS